MVNDKGPSKAMRIYERAEELILQQANTQSTAANTGSRATHTPGNYLSQQNVRTINERTQPPSESSACAPTSPQASAVRSTHDSTTSIAGLKSTSTASASKKRKAGDEDEALSSRNIPESKATTRKLESSGKEQAAELEPSSKRRKVRDDQYDMSTALTPAPEDKASRRLKTSQTSKRGLSTQSAAAQTTSFQPTTTGANFDPFFHGVNRLGHGAAWFCTYIGTHGWPLAVSAGKLCLGTGTELMGDFCDFLADCLAKRNAAQAPTITGYEHEMRPTAVRILHQESVALPQISEPDLPKHNLNPPPVPSVRTVSLRASGGKTLPSFAKTYNHGKFTRVKRESAFAKDRRPTQPVFLKTATFPKGIPTKMPAFMSAAAPALQHIPVEVSKHGDYKLDLFRHNLRDTILTEPEVKWIYLSKKKGILPKFNVSPAGLARAKQLVVDRAFAEKLPNLHFLICQWVAEYEQIDQEIEFKALAQKYQGTNVTEQEVLLIYKLHKNPKSWRLSSQPRMRPFAYVLLSRKRSA